jgi:hypothetical protein
MAGTPKMGVLKIILTCIIGIYLVAKNLCVEVRIWIFTALIEVPQKDLIFRCCLIHLKKISIFQR